MNFGKKVWLIGNSSEKSKKTLNKLSNILKAEHCVFDDINPISNFTGNLVLEFAGYTLDMDNIKYSVEECKERDTTYAAPLKVAVRLQNKETGEIKE